MNHVALLFQEYGALGIVLIVFAKRMGVPVPVLPFLLLAGARGETDAAFVLNAAAGACVAAAIADQLWFAAGRRFGRSMLALMCKLSISPDTCIRKSELAFSRRGSLTVLLAKFIPGVGGLAPPLAGAAGMSAARFAGFNLAGTMLWIGSGVAAGWILRRELTHIVEAFEQLGFAGGLVLGAAALGYIAWLAIRRSLVIRAAMRVPRFDPQQVAEKIARGEQLAFVDVRGPQSAVGEWIPGATHAFFDAGARHDLSEFVPGVVQVIYCDCPSDVSAARVAVMLRRRGLPAYVLAGGFAAWRAAGLPVEGILVS